MDVIKSYLVGLGFQVNQAEFNNATNKLKEVDKVVNTTISSMVKNFATAATAATAVVVAMTAITKAVVETTVAVAENDLAFQKLSNRMWVSKESAKEMKMSMDALGESMEDIAFTPELRGQYNELIELGRKINTPSDAPDQLKGIRAMVFEFKKLKMEVAYATEWVAYYLTKYLGAPLASIKKQFAEFNDKLIQTMPTWTKDIARVLATVVSVEMSLVRFAKDLYVGFSKFFGMLTKGMSTTTKVILGLWAVLKFTPIGWITMAVMGLMILIEDFYGFLDGRKSSKTLAPVWQKLIDFFKKVDKWTSETLPAFIRRFDKLIDVITKLVTETLNTLYMWLVVIFDEISGACERGGVMESFIDAFNSIGDGVTSLIEGFTELMKAMGIFSKDTKFKGFWRWFGSELSAELKLIAAFAKAVGDLANIIGLLMKGDVKGAMALDKKAGNDLKNSAKKYFSRTNRDEGFEAFLGAISGQESGGNYDAVNGRTGASGKYQIMPENWPSWSAEAGLSANSPMTPENQEIVAQYKLKQYYDKYGARGAAIAWYAGEGAVDYSENTKNRKQGNGDEPSMNEYADSILERMGNYQPSEQETKVAEQQESNIDYNNEMRNARLNYGASKEQAVLSYAPSPVPNYQAGQTLINVGDINIAGTNASVTEIQQAVVSGLTMAQDRQISRNMRDFGGVFG